ncbi:PRC-barrel domain containing protein [Halomarina salina]|uniref:PRC-barrel domain containing protein n=1 Tax=Halomarina salina TaxID=1872699 RepID=A0ABD5RII7_9EURY|nr:PRC-barrel domain containing protein [Halomarina salina]
MTARFTDEDEGKRVVDDQDNVVGRVVEVAGGTAHVDPDPGMTDTVRSKLGLGDADGDTFAIDESSVEAITDDEIRISRTV